MSGAARAFLVLNAGSSSLKFGLYAADDLAALCRGGIEVIGLGGGRARGVIRENHPARIVKRKGRMRCHHRRDR